MTPTPGLRLLGEPNTAGTPPAVVEQAKPAKLMGPSAPHDTRSWSTITWPSVAGFALLFLVAWLFLVLAVQR